MKKTVSFRATQAEIDSCRTQAHAAGMSASEFLRFAINLLARSQIHVWARPEARFDFPNREGWEMDSIDARKGTVKK